MIPGEHLFTHREWVRLSGFYGMVALLHLCGWGLWLYWSRPQPVLFGLGLAAYTLGLRHAFDADHIAAVDDTVRFLREKGQRPLGIGFFFSLGHSSVVFILTLATVFAAAAISRHLTQWQGTGALIGGAVSAGFLWVIGSLNLLVLLKILQARGSGGLRSSNHSHLTELLDQRGFFNRFCGRWARRFINHSWQMYPLGLLFGLGFDTASEVALLAMTAGAATGQIPPAAVLSLPVLFAAGMVAIDTTDGVVMTTAYEWALVNAARRYRYNVVLTGLSVVLALAIGTIEWLQVLIGLRHLHGGGWDRLSRLNFAMLGCAAVVLFLGVWVVSALLGGRRPTPQPRSCHRGTVP